MADWHWELFRSTSLASQMVMFNVQRMWSESERPLFFW